MPPVTFNLIRTRSMCHKNGQFFNSCRLATIFFVHDRSPTQELSFLFWENSSKQNNIEKMNDYKLSILQIFIVWSTTLIETIKNNCTGKYEKKKKWDRRKKDFWRNLRWSELFPHPFSSLLVRLCISTTHWISSSIVIISRKKKRERTWLF